MHQKQNRHRHARVYRHRKVALISNILIVVLSSRINGVSIIIILRILGSSLVEALPRGVAALAVWRHCVVMRLPLCGHDVHCRGG